MNKPLQKHCAKYCESYPCNKKKCTRKLGFNGKGEMYMMNERDSKYFDYLMKRKLYREVDLNDGNGAIYSRMRTI